MSRVPDAYGWVALSDFQFVNIVNHEHAYADMSKDDAVHAAVKATEAKLREINVAIIKPTLRDYFAGKAMQAMVAAEFEMYAVEHKHPGGMGVGERWAQQAVLMADALIAELKK